MNPPILVDFTNVMDESEQFPLDIHFGSRAESEVIQPFLHADVGKDRFHDTCTACGASVARRRAYIFLPSGVSIRAFICSIRLGCRLPTSMDKKRRDVVGVRKQ